jgi:hypothetical protein
MTLDHGQKVGILIAALQERYQALRTIRDRVQSIGVWALGLLIGAGGFVVQADEPLSRPDRLLSSLCVIGAVGVLRLVYLADLEKGFSAQQRTAARLEATLGLYDVGVFDQDQGPMYPANWADAGKDKGGGRFFAASYALLYAGALSLLLALAFG